MNDTTPRQTRLTAAEFEPLDAQGQRRKLPLSPGHLALGFVVLLAVLVLGFLFAARAVIFLPDPAEAEIDVGGLSFHIGNNYLLLPGRRTVSASAPGYRPLEREVVVTRGESQEIELPLEPLPGRLNLVSELPDVKVLIDGQEAGVAPGVIEEVSRGPHVLEFVKHRYFPLKQEVEVEGLGTTQDVAVALEPAWGQMSFSSAPDGAELYVDGQLIGTTPLATEILETGSAVSISARGYKTWQAEVSVKAGTSAEHPPVTLVVADGTLEITSTPPRAGITIDQEFRGVTPLTVPLSPLRGHQVELFLEGYRKAQRTVSVEPEQHSSLAVSLTPIIGRIRLTVAPDDAEVLVDGRVQGTGSRELQLTAREHRITVRKAGYAEQSMAVTPRPEHAQSLEFTLLTLEQDYWSTRPPAITSPVGSQLRLFRPGASFSLGAPRREPGRRANEAERSVRLERPFYIGVLEVTNAEFRSWKENHSSRAFRGQTLDMDNQPVANVAWQEAALFCNWLSRREGLPVFYVEEQGVVTGFDVNSHGYRLPTEAEWAWVARYDADGQSLMFPWGGDQYPPPAVHGNYADQSAARLLNFVLANYNDGFVTSAPVGSFAKNSKGLYDLDGNVGEWVNDFYEIRPSRETELDPTGPEVGSRHVIRGASWSKGSRSELRMSYREAGAEPLMDVGFRLARYVDRAGVKQ